MEHTQRPAHGLGAGSDQAAPLARLAQLSRAVYDDEDKDYGLSPAAWAAGHTVVPIPGPSSVTAGLSIAGYGGPGFTFLGYLPRKPGEMRRLLEALRDDPRPAVAFESPYRIGKSLALIAESLPQRHLTVTRELTKVHEEILRGTASDVLAALGERARGEFTVVISGG